MIQPGIYRNLSFPDYLNDPAVSRSVLGRFAELPANVLYPVKETEALLMGRLFHMAALEPERFVQEVVIYDKRRYGKEWDKFQAGNKGKTILTLTQRKLIYAWLDALDEYDFSLEMIAESDAEVSVFWTDQTGIRMKSRPDLVCGGEYLSDLKTCRSLTDRALSNDILSYRYHWQAYMGLKGFEAYEKYIDEWRLIFVSKTPYAGDKHGVRFIKITRGDEWWDMAETQVNQALADYKRCMEDNHFPSYPNRLETIPPPSWATANDEPLTMDGEAMF